MSEPPNQTKMTPAFHTKIAYLRARLAESLPGLEAQLRMAPQYRRDPRTVAVDGKDCREGAVLALLFPLDGEVATVLTVRHADLNHHAGQVSFPGGRRDLDETLQETAVREAYEEIGLPADKLTLLGQLTPLYIPPSNFCVYPFVGTTDHRPAYEPHDAEVEHILEVPIRHLLNPETRVEEMWDLRGQRVVVPYYDVAGYTVWGATAMILSELLQILKETGM